jgi:hypothetical protein
LTNVVVLHKAQAKAREKRKAVAWPPLFSPG